MRNKQSIVQSQIATWQFHIDGTPSLDRESPTTHHDLAPSRFVDRGVRFESVNLISHVSSRSTVIDPS